METQRSVRESPVHATAIIQARMGSSRLPGKVMLPLFDKTILGHVIARLQQSHLLNDLLVATTVLNRDDDIVAEANKYDVQVYRGSEEDVLGRFYEAARLTSSDWIVRITADCPLLDAELVDAMLNEVGRSPTPIDYISNTLMRTYPRGLDVEIISKTALGDACLRAKRDDEREHVTPYIYRHPKQYRLQSYVHAVDYAHYRWTLDTAEDWLFIQAIYHRLYPSNERFSWQDVLQCLHNEPELILLNKNVEQKRDPI